MLVAAAQGAAKKRDKIFCVGPGHTGTHTLEAMLKNLSYRSCHLHCLQKSWARETQQHDASSEVFTNFDAFMDAGDFADWRWLEQAFSTARFALNTRPLFEYLVSLYDHKRLRKNYTMTAAQLVGHVCGLAARQEEMLAHFDRPERRDRFAVVALTDPNVRGVVEWLARPRLNSHQAARLVTSSADLPERFGERGRPVALLFAQPHDAIARDFVRRALIDHGCPPAFWNDTLYSCCAKTLVDDCRQRS
ncbi:hypothetical protein CTAYLR_007943 [Chrysophaeum taylorii]|uniref:Sulfotransferase family protein n=1 Tax=Chrysophaeum taylorii TaxID=2483200 RepID=A0AAD7XTP3_9STRA|nr:hypothetical protein CTAYLR_007943 [Chrysophaeum taylorii]